MFFKGYNLTKPYIITKDDNGYTRQHVFLLSNHKKKKIKLSNSLITRHGSLIFFFLIPLAADFNNYQIYLQQAVSFDRNL